jgi:hypothetical protein
VDLDCLGLSLAENSGLSTCLVELWLNSKVVMEALADADCSGDYGGIPTVLLQY